MNRRKVMYAEAPKNLATEIVEGEVIADFLPPPEALIRKEAKVKIEAVPKLHSEGWPSKLPA